MLEWGLHNRVFYELEREGKLIGIHVGNRVWYSRAQLIELLGEPGLAGGNQGDFVYTDDVMTA